MSLPSSLSLSFLLAVSLSLSIYNKSALVIKQTRIYYYLLCDKGRSLLQKNPAQYHDHPCNP